MTSTTINSGRLGVIQLTGLFYLIILAFGTPPVFAQDNYSVYLNEAEHDSTRAQGLNLHVSKLMKTDMDSAEIMCNAFIVFAKSFGNKKYEAIGYRSMAKIYASKGEPLKSLELLHQSLMLVQEIGHLELTANTYNTCGIVHGSMGNYSLSAENYLNSLRIEEQIGDPKRLEKSLRNLGICFSNIEDYDKAEEYYQRGLKIVKDNKLDYSLPSYYNSLGNVKGRRSEADSAIFYYLKIIELGDSVRNQKLIGAAYHNLALTYWTLKKDFPIALNYFEKALQAKQKIGWASAYGSTYTGLGGVNSALKNYSESLIWCFKSLEDARKNRSLPVEKNACGCLYEAYKGLGKLDSALKYHEMLEVLTDSLTDIDREKEINRKELGYNFEKKALADSLQHAGEQLVLVEKTEKQRLGLFATGAGLILLLTLAFSIYSGKKKSEELLLNILPYETAQELKKKGYADAKLIEHVTVLFTDFKGFTAMAEKLTARELVADIHVCFSEFDRIMDKYGIEKIKTIGDAYMAAGGLPSPSTGHAKNVVMAALEMRDFIEFAREGEEVEDSPNFEIRIGIHTGPVVAGIVGIKKFAYDIWGDTVNTASRMESSGEVAKVNISQSTYESLKDDAAFSFTPRGKIEAKGKGEIEMYFVELSV